MADDRPDMRRQFARYRAAPDLVRELAARTDDGTAFKSSMAVPPPAARTIIELNADYPGGLAEARDAVVALLATQAVPHDPPERSRHYIFATLTLAQIAALTEPGGDPTAPTPIYKIWRDEVLYPLLNRSVRTIKADACLTAFGADGTGIVVAVADSGIDGTHRHFARHANLALPAGLAHMDFTPGGDAPLVDGFGHGTHVAGIVAGQCDGPLTRLSEVRAADDTVRTIAEDMAEGVVLRGVAPKARLLSLKVLDDAGRGFASGLIAALEHLETLNDFGRRIKVHCVNLSLGYPFDASWFAAGHSPLCAVVNRVSRSGVVVVAAAGNDGSALVQTEGRPDRQRVGQDQSINDPGNADEAITVGATHGEMPHMYGVSWFSSRGPTADGRVKPDLVAPGERILSCAAAGSFGLAEALDAARATATPDRTYYREESGTSMAAPHVAGAVAALLSVRAEYIGRADAVKAVFTGSCTDLGRKRDFQGAGLIDLMRAIQSV